MTKYRVQFRDMNTNVEWIEIEPENIDMMISEDILENFDIPDDADNFTLAVIMAKAIHMLDGYEGYHSRVVNSDTLSISHYFVSDEVDLMNPDWLKKLTSIYHIDDHTFEIALKHEQTKITNSNLRNLFSHLNQGSHDAKK